MNFLPQSYLSLRSGYSLTTLRRDLIAGVTVGIIALPLAMAFAIASGSTPDKGLITAIIAGFLISALGGSRVQVGGPTGAFVVLIYSILERNGYSGLAFSTLVGALLLLMFGLFRLGSLIKYVPRSLIVGFTTGIAVIIFSSQIKDLLGLEIGTPPANFIDKWGLYLRSLPSAQGATLLVGGVALGLILLLRRFLPKLPWGITAIVIVTSFTWFFELPIATIFSTFGEIPNCMTFPTWPELVIPKGKLLELLIDGVSIALLGGIESLLCAVIGDEIIGHRHNSNVELMGQGVANFASVLFGGIPATGGIARTAANARAGAQTPVAGMVHALTLLAIVLFLAPLVSQIPLTALAAVLVMIAWNMSELPQFFKLLRSSRAEAVVLMATFLLTVFVNITVAIGFGMLLAFLFRKKLPK